MTKTQRRAFLWLLIMTLGWLLSRQEVQASTPLKINLKQPVEAASKYQRPEDLLSMIPFLGEIPHTFLIGDGFNMKISGTSLRIDHMGRGSKATVKNRDCMIGLSYVTPVAGFFTSRVDFPLFYSPTPEMSQWSMNTLGDYVAYFSKGAVDSKSFRLALSAKF